MKRMSLLFSLLLVCLSSIAIAQTPAPPPTARSPQASTETVLYDFVGGSYGDGANPQSRLTSDGAGNFYGTTYGGGTGGNGTVFELSPDGSGGWNETVIYRFNPQGCIPCSDGYHPYLSYVLFDSAGNLYGTTYRGGTSDGGVVFELSPVGTGWTETILYNFCSQRGCTDGAHPANGLIMDPSGNLYGTTMGGGDEAGNGTVFELSPSGGGWTEQVIYEFDTLPSDAGVTMDSAGNIFGITYNPGTVFELSPNGNGGWNPTVIHAFTGTPKDGYYPEGTPVLDKAGNLYGTTNAGGAKNNGTVYKLSPGKEGKPWTEKILYSFKGNKDGVEPVAGIAFDASGNIYGTTVHGGVFGVDDGTVFELVAPVGKGSYKEKVVLRFNVTDGSQPVGSLILDTSGILYGTTQGGGSNNDCGSGGCGVVFEITP